MTETEAEDNDLSALRILIVEDEYYVADDLARALEGLGATVLGPVATLEEAERLVAEGRFDCAVLDMNLRGEMAFPIADRLEAQGIPFVVASGYNSASLPDRFSAVPRVEKPYDPAQVVAILPRARSGGSSETLLD
ncbi:MAG TPA: response regulator [Allosphingosinicella sp.]|nr:response regulator [Allosphingosinicella sp.]